MLKELQVWDIDSSNISPTKCYSYMYMHRFGQSAPFFKSHTKLAILYKSQLPISNTSNQYFLRNDQRICKIEDLINGKLKVIINFDKTCLLRNCSNYMSPNSTLQQYFSCLDGYTCALSYARQNFKSFSAEVKRCFSFAQTISKLNFEFSFENQ